MQSPRKDLIDRVSIRDDYRRASPKLPRLLSSALCHSLMSSSLRFGGRQRVARHGCGIREQPTVMNGVHIAFKG